jgi:acetyl-CoA carboxylase biotin carboxyl carrier protein
MNLTLADVEEILKILDASPFDELEVETDRFRLVLRRSGTAAGGWTETREAKTATRPAVVKAAPAARAAAPVADGTLPVPAPLIGTFYRAPKPGAPPFVEVGSRVTRDTVVGIVETMKLMNSVYAGTAGVVHAIDAADGEFVEQNHVLMRILPAK